jgi:hypothetical protein
VILLEILFELLATAVRQAIRWKRETPKFFDVSYVLIPWDPNARLIVEDESVGD